MNPHSDNPDRLLTPDELAKKLGMTKRQVLEHSKGRSPRIPRIKLNDRVILFHLPTVLSCLTKTAALTTISSSVWLAFGGYATGM